MGPTQGVLTRLGDWLRLPTPFHSRTVPGITLGAYLDRLACFLVELGVTHADRLLLVACLYVMRYLTAQPHVRFTPYNMHRLALAATLVAFKVETDDSPGHELRAWAAVGGVPVDELRTLECAFLAAVQWRVFIDHETHIVLHAAYLAHVRS